MSVHNDPRRAEFGYERPKFGHHAIFDAALRRKQDALAEQSAIGNHLADMLLAGNIPDTHWRAAYAEKRAAAEYAAAVYEVEAAKVRAA